MGSATLPVFRDVSVDPLAERIAQSNGDLAAALLRGGAAQPSGTVIRGFPPGERIDDKTRGIEEDHFVARIRKAEDSPFHPSRVAVGEGEVRAEQGVLNEARRVSRDEEPPTAWEDGVDRERGRGLAIRQGPAAHIDG